MAIEFKYATDEDNRVYVSSHACPKCKKFALCSAEWMGNRYMMCGDCDTLFDFDLEKLPIQHPEKFKCSHCKLQSVNGHDPCISDLPGVRYACCGHGKEDAYIMLESGHIIRGKFDHVERQLEES